MADSPADEAFRGEIRGWLADNLTGPFAGLRGAGGPGREHEAHAERLAWDRHLAAADWSCPGWPAELGGRGLTLAQQVIFHEEYARSGAPARAGYMGEELLGPTLIEFGTPEQQDRFLPGIRAVRELWCQGYLFSRADTIYGGSDEIQRGIIAGRALGLPREARS